MIVELGHFALVLALCLAVLQGTAAFGFPAWARPAARLQFACVLLAFAGLSWAFVVHDYTLDYVAANSNLLLPLRYRLTAVWGAHEGSMLLWGLILATWMAALSFARGPGERFITRALGVAGLIAAGFLLFLLVTSNPFLRHVPAPVDGADLNPLLQDFGMIVHPPVLYAGYVGFVVPFAFAVAALLERSPAASWVPACRPWAVAAWVFLTLGIALGSWWAYYELGWGGWWFWDPVENASFMPWLLGTALVHSLAVTDRRGVFESWTLLLAIGTFALSILGTFLVRSGVLTSVHAFATDPTRGVFILALLGLTVGGALTLYAWRAPARLAGGGFTPASRETFLLCNSVLLVVSVLTILLGTLYPLAAEALGAGKLSVGTPYFNAVFVPLMVLVLLAMGLGVMARWQAEVWRELRLRARPAALATAVITALCAVALSGSNALVAAFGLGLACWVVAGILTAAWTRRRWSAGFAGMCLAHVGLAVCVCGVVISSRYSEELHRRMEVGDELAVGGYRFTLAALEERTGPNYTAVVARFNARSGDGALIPLAAERRHYMPRDVIMTEAGIAPGIWRDLYVSLGEPLADGGFSVRLNYKPLVRWIWLGALLMALGGAVTLADRRYRALRPAETSLGAESPGALPSIKAPAEP